MFVRGIILFSLFIFFNTSLAFKASDSYPGIVKLIQKDENGVSIAFGTAFFISPDTMLTAAHVVREDSFYFRDAEEQVLVEVIGLNKKYDIAFLRAIDYETEDFYSLVSLDETTEMDLLRLIFYLEKGKIVSKEAQVKESVIIPGFPNGPFNIIEGVITGYHAFTALVRVKQTDPEISNFSGLSGSPVFSENGKLIGVLIAKIREQTFIFSLERLVFVPLEIIRYFFRKVQWDKIEKE